MGSAHKSGFCPIVLTAVWLGIAPTAAPARAEPSLGNLFGSRPEQQHDPSAELQQVWHALTRRPFASDPVVQGALAQAQRELALLREAWKAGAQQAVVQRRTNLVWAALSAADRLQARIATAAALAGLEQRARDTEAAAERAGAALQHSQKVEVAADPPPPLAADPAAREHPSSAPQGERSL